MRRPRNPRFAPEFLERRLHPDASTLSLVAIVYTSTSVTSDDGMPPTPTPPPPTTGPSGPAMLTLAPTTL